MKSKKMASRGVGEDHGFHARSTFVRSATLNETDRNQMLGNRAPCPTSLVGGKKLADDPINGSI